MASETGVLDIPPAQMSSSSAAAFSPGRMFLVDSLAEGPHYRATTELKRENLSRRQPYGQWLREQQDGFSRTCRRPRRHSRH